MLGARLNDLVQTQTGKEAKGEETLFAQRGYGKDARDLKLVQHLIGALGQGLTPVLLGSTKYRGLSRHLPICIDVVDTQRPTAVALSRFQRMPRFFMRTLMTSATAHSTRPLPTG